ncbi:CRISP/Allergen/PR-1 [Ixodes scapularis]|uniref:CRISP/Allergen/PR-1 n=1 Tax=Ixodes scapularis TaxID=6945 RepID=UPI001A9FD62D|nr:CRISP/Allergen/PR-1 [Ixodes scapularis]
MTHVEDKIKSALGVTILKDGWMNNCVVMNTGVSQDEVKEILRLHNDYRQKAAQGLIRNLPAAADMMELVWDRELATIAQAHSSQCQFKHDCLDCRKVPRFATGQNMFRFKTNDPNPDEPSDWESAITSWEEKEEQFFDPSEVKKLRAKSDKAAHLSQVLWAKSVYLGCGQTKYKFKGEKHYQKLFTCIYGPQ